MAFRSRTLLQRSRALVAGLAVAVGLGAAGAQAMPFFEPEPGVMHVRDHDGYGDRGYGRGHDHHRGHDRGWGGGHRGWDHGRGYGRRDWGRHHHHHGGGYRGYYPY